MEPLISDSAKIRWLQGIHADGWVATRAFLKLSHVRAVSLRTYLRAGEDQRAKGLVFYAEGARIAEATLQRGRLNEIDITLPAARETVILTIESEYPEVRMTGQDARPRGFMLRAMRIDGEAWQPPVVDDGGGPDDDDKFTVFDYITAEPHFDANVYRDGFAVDEPVPGNMLLHYLTKGWTEGRDPAGWFSTAYYLHHNADVAATGTNPFVHFIKRGRDEGRLGKAADAPAPAPAELPTTGFASDFFAEQRYFTAPGPGFEEHDRSILRARAPEAKLFAYYLPQFHPIAENDAWWGAGFTEWRNVARGLPRFKGHYQPRIPRDLGHYDLRRAGVLAEQARLARASGIHGFCFYYYSFNGRRLLDSPIEAFLADPSIDISFTLMWANENWTRTWDGHDRDVLISQNYRAQDENGFIADVARHFGDPRYFRIDGRPLFFIYRPALIPDAAATIARWREAFQHLHDENPLIFMAQGFDDLDPRPHGLDGAIEFPPHKVAAGHPALNASLERHDRDYTGTVIDYDRVTGKSTAEEPPDFPLIKCAVPSWDNEARRPGKGMVLQGSTPAKYYAWLRSLVTYAKANPVFGTKLVAVNAWNEWAEAAYLEPDVHYGAAYLNATARAVTGAPLHAAGRYKMLMVCHDAYRHGAQMLALHIATTLVRQFGIELHVIICGDGPLLADYEKIAKCTVVRRSEPMKFESLIATLADQGYSTAIVNTAVCGWVLPGLKAKGFSVCTLVHELKTLIQEYQLEDEVAAIARHSDVVVFAAPFVGDSFLEIAGRVEGKAVIQPQGLYKTGIARPGMDREAARARIGLPADAKLVINVGYADFRKGFDIFVQAARDMLRLRADVHFIWVGDATPGITRWLLPELQASRIAERFTLTGFTDAVEDYYAAADVFLLTSREDPFPSVVLEALAAGLPVVGFHDSTGSALLIETYGKLVDRMDPPGIIAALGHFIDQPHATIDAAAEHRRAAIADHHQNDDYSHALLRLADNSIAKISVIVPNYNYARYLEARLSTIFQQSYPVFEIIVLDDGSSDDSLAIIESCAAEHGRHIDLVVNEQNSGSVFRQWELGVRRARGDLIWIAEADDLADETFLEVLAGAIQSQDAALVFSDSWQIDMDGNTTGASYKFYVNGIEPGMFDTSFVLAGEEFSRRFLSVKNVILNVSSVLWRRTALLSALADVGNELFDYRGVGDWRIYLEICRGGGAIAYEARALNGHRRHQTSVTHAHSARSHYDEILAMQAKAASTMTLGPDILRARAAHRGDARQTLKLEGIPDADPARVNGVDGL